MSIQDAHKKIPLMFRSQIIGRSQLHYLKDKDKTSDAEKWVSEWIEKVYEQPIEWGNQVKTKTFQFNWRLVTNGGQDDGMIRPVIGAFGLPFFPGSSMKGAFLRTCNPTQAARYCGKTLKNGESAPGILRFHGGYPTEDYDWTENLLDLVHPQQGWQVETQDTGKKPSGAFALVSLFEPEFQFAISSTESLSDEEWETIWQLWNQAIASGLGCRVSAGYGQPNNANISQDALIGRFHLKGEGLTSHTLDNNPEFRPNMFKAAIRGHALRIFGGLTDANNAKTLVENLFGGVSGNGAVGLVKMYWQHEKPLRFSNFQDGYNEDIYQAEGTLKWIFSSFSLLSTEEKKALSNLIKNLTRFAMLFGGFGKSWRRADHDLFYGDYYDDKKPLIGCHWQYGRKSHSSVNLVRKVETIKTFIEKVRESARTWMKLRGVTPSSIFANNWREAWHPNKVQVWARIAEDKGDSKAIRWFHGRYGAGSIYRSHLTGKMNEIGRIWHRMYPKFNLKKNEQAPKKPIIESTKKYIEILTIFPDDSRKFMDFQQFLQDSQSRGNGNPFQLVWGNLKSYSELKLS